MRQPPHIAMFRLRDYQERAITLLYSWLRQNRGNPCIVAPTGSGKSLIIAGLCRDILNRWGNSRILILSHVKELLEQDAGKVYSALADRLIPIGIYSAGIGRKELGAPVTIASIQSVRDRAEDVGFVDLVIVDEAHLINHKAEGGYRKFLSGLQRINPDMRVIGLTATPYRMGCGLITEGETALFDALIEPVGISELIARGFLAPLRSKLPGDVLNVEHVRKRAGDFVEKDLQSAVNTDGNNKFIVEETIRRAGDRKSWLIFCTGVAHAEAVRKLLEEKGIAAGIVTGNMAKKEREETIAGFKNGSIRALINIDVLSVGFDYPDIDLIVMARPTMSPGLYCQQAGRGMRLKSHTDHCLVLDFAGNVKRHGPVTDVRPPKRVRGGHGEAPVKVCPRCDEILHASMRVCPSCGYEFPPAAKEKVKLHSEDIMGYEPVTTDVAAWDWNVITSRKSGIDMLRVRYYPPDMTEDSVSEYILLHHEGYSRYKAESLMRKLAEKSGADMSKFVAGLDGKLNLAMIAEAMNIAKCPGKITYERDGKFKRVLARTWEEGPGAVGA